jgi:AraC family transcriptional regulator, transcriptional activator of pobA
MRSTGRGVPNFSLYGEPTTAHAQIDGMHIEGIQSRSRKYLWKIAAHRHTLLSQCIFVSAGPVTVELDERRCDLAGPAVMIIPAGTVHSFRFRADTEGQVLTVDLDRVLGIASAAHRSPIEALFSEARAVDLRQDLRLAARVRQLLAQLEHEFKEPDSITAPVGGWLACSALWILAHSFATYGAAGSPSNQEALRMRRFRQLIEAHFLKHWPVARYARQLALSETSLNRFCRRVAGCTAFELLQQRLALEARRRLVYGAGSVSAIAAELGFKDPAYFCRFFRRRGGVSPNEFRRNHRGG